jgi:pimeloyl-ACP methyl ester carboxylesterase
MTEPVVDGETIRVDTGEVTLHVRRDGGGSAGTPVVLVHGSLDDHRAWGRVAGEVVARHPVVTWDRRGHGRSTCPPGQGRISEDLADLVAVLEQVVSEPALVVGHSYGACVVMLLAAERPELTAGIVLHEPPLFGLLADDPASSGLGRTAAQHIARASEMIQAGEAEHGVRTFVDDVAFGPGTWATVFDDDLRATCVSHADTWLDQSRDPERLRVQPALLVDYPHPVVLSHGDSGPATYAAVVRLFLGALPSVCLETIPGAGHAPHLTHPAEMAEIVLCAAGRVTNG